MPDDNVKHAYNYSGITNPWYTISYYQTTVFTESKDRKMRPMIQPSTDARRTPFRHYDTST